MTICKIYSIRESEGVEEEEEAPVSESDADATAGSFDNDQSTGNEYFVAGNC